MSAAILSFQLFLAAVFPCIIHAKTIEIIVDKIAPFTLTPKNIGKVSYVPIRPALEALGWKLEWNPVNNTVTCTKGNDKTVFKVNSTIAYISSEQIILKHPLIIINGAAYIQSKLIADHFGTRIRWNKKDNLIIVSSNINCDIAVNGYGNIVAVGNGIIVNIVESYGIDTLYDMLDYADSLLASNLYIDALAKYKEILKDLSQEDNPEIYAQIMNNTGNAYTLNAQDKDTLKNILNAIDSYKKALNYYSSKPEEIKSYIIRNNLGNAYKILWEVTGNNEYLQTAAKHYQIAASHDWSEHHLFEYASMQYNLGFVHAESGQYDLAITSLSYAKEIYKDYLNLHNLKDTPLQYAIVQQKLGDIYQLLYSMSPTEENCSNSIKAYEKCLDVWTVESYPKEYASVQKCLGDINRMMLSTHNSDKQVKKTISLYKESLLVYTQDKYPVEYAKVNYALGNVYIANNKNLIYALNAYNEALEVFTKEDFPYYHQMLVNSISYINL